MLSKVLGDYETVFQPVGLESQSNCGFCTDKMPTEKTYLLRPLKRVATWALVGGLGEDTHCNSNLPRGLSVLCTV